jgi:translation initiation factor IF-2
VEVVLGHAYVKALFKYSKVGTIAGCVVKDGKIVRNTMMRVIRDGKMIFEGKLDTLKRFKEDAKEVATGFECGISTSGFNTFAEGDIIECYEIRMQARKV